MNPVHSLLSALLLLCLTQTAVCCLPFGAITSKVTGLFKSSSKTPRLINIGCFLLRKPEEYEGDVGSMAALEAISWDKCRDHCYGSKAEAPKEEHIGLQNTNCWCKYKFPKSDLTTDGKCDTLCAGNDRQTCGGKDHISVYSARMDS